ncbi:hypothetical protein BX659_10288 [Orenia metallireducens]|uniref:Uncharacterized protein n=1 Tax=Orenia metallireducens TaxID=1413210 RepID=A0A285F2N2_9FIRM|nr:hypothetical protein [Orenia metallireducens]PRX34773.1 hypothetical protein BX659_10288 [Orenia metallireducens]SNY05570.1 hypothetical protein SAMN06265827_10188 [Orenia metallireducens]
MFRLIKRVIGLSIMIIFIAIAIFAYNLYQSEDFNDLNISKLVEYPLEKFQELLGENKEIIKVLNDLQDDGIKLNQQLVAKISEEVEGNGDKIEVIKVVGEELLKDNPDYDRVLEELNKLGIDISKEELMKLKKE